MQYILLASDGSEGAQRATAVAIELARGLGSKLTILCVAGTQELSRRDLRELERAEGNVGEAIEATSQRICSNAMAAAHAAGISSVHVESAWGDPAEQIIDAVNRLHADAIVMGRRGHGRLAGLLLGSVSQKVVSLAPCIVTLVP